MFIALPCGICGDLFDHKDHRPQRFCNKGHLFCKTCCSKLEKCPDCREPKASDQHVGDKTMQKFDLIRADLKQKLPIIARTELSDLDTDPDAGGANADVFKCSWNSTTVALKKLRFKASEAQKEELLIEAAIGFQLQHPHIVRVFGMVELKNNFSGILMEWADLGTLAEQMESMSKEEKVKSSLCICQALDYMHSKKLAHRDLKPQNVLLFGNKSTAKLSDFGTSKVIQTIQTINTAVGTPVYAAPELASPGISNSEFFKIRMFV